MGSPLGELEEKLETRALSLGRREGIPWRTMQQVKSIKNVDGFVVSTEDKGEAWVKEKSQVCDMSI